MPPKFTIRTLAKRTADTRNRHPIVGCAPRTLIGPFEHGGYRGGNLRYVAHGLPISYRFGRLNSTCSERKRGPPASGKYPEAVGCERPSSAEGVGGLAQRLGMITTDL